MTVATGRADTTPSAKQAAMAVIEKQPGDASWDEIVDALWTWSMAEPAGADVCNNAANRLLALNPAELVMGNRAAREAAVPGMSRQKALDALEGLPERASLDDIIVAVAA